MLQDINAIINAVTCMTQVVETQQQVFILVNGEDNSFEYKLLLMQLPFTFHCMLSFPTQNTGNQ